MIFVCAVGRHSCLITPSPRFRRPQVTLTDSFWAPKLETNRRVTIPHIMRENETTGRVDNFRKAAQQMPGPYTRTPLQRHRHLQGGRGRVALAEGEAGSGARHEGRRSDRAHRCRRRSPTATCFPARTIDPKNPAAGVGPERWVYENGSHELYNSGHLYEAAVAHFLSTGKRTLLDVAIKNADLVAATFGPNGRHAVPGPRGDRGRPGEDVSRHRQPEVPRHREVLHRRARQAAPGHAGLSGRARSRCTTSAPTSRTRRRSSIRRARSATPSARCISTWGPPTSPR